MEWIVTARRACAEWVRWARSSGAAGLPKPAPQAHLLLLEACSHDRAAPCESPSRYGLAAEEGREPAMVLKERQALHSWR